MNNDIRAESSSSGEDESKNWVMPNPVALNELITKTFPPLEWVARDLIPSACVTVLSGDGGAYKSYMMQHLAACVVSGRPFLNFFETAKTGVLIVDEENGYPLLQSRLRSLVLDESAPIYTLCDSGFVVGANSIRQLIEFAKSNGIGVVIFDALIRIIGNADENTSTDMAKIFGSIRKFKEAGIAAIVIHHNRKQGERNLGAAQNMRGSSDIRNAADCHIGVKVKDTNEISFEPTKVRTAKPIPHFLVRVEENDSSVSFAYVGMNARVPAKSEQIPSYIVATLSDTKGSLNKTQLISAVCSKANVGHSTVQQVLGRMVKDGEVLTRKGVNRNSLICSLPETSQELAA